MLAHNFSLKRGNCNLRPVTEADEDQIIELWNADHVVGSLYMSKTTHAAYRRFFDSYCGDPNEWRWVIQTNDGEFVGTIRIYCRDGQYTLSQFALWPTKSFLAVVPCILAIDFAFENFCSDTINIDLPVHNTRIQKLHKILGAHDTGGRRTFVASNGQTVTQEQWVYKRDEWNRNRSFIESLCS